MKEWKIEDIESEQWFSGGYYRTTEVEGEVVKLIVYMVAYKMKCYYHINAKY